MDIGADIRDRNHLSGDELLGLNFIKACGPYRFRRHYRSGLRSLIFEVLFARDLEKETCGEKMDGLILYPRARPVKMLRILRARFPSTQAVLEEIRKYRMLLNWVGPDLIALSEEFMVDYVISGRSHILLCGLQEYVFGEILDVWKISSPEDLRGIFSAMPGNGPDFSLWLNRVIRNISRFVLNVRRMVDQTGFIPDLAGIGNLILTRAGDVKLVDINNIVPVTLDPEISIDDKGYPCCDVSMEVLFILKKIFLPLKPCRKDSLYRHFFNPKRRERVKVLEQKFYTARDGFSLEFSGFVSR